MELLFEILTEEMPSRMQTSAAEAIAYNIKHELEARIGSQIAIHSFVTPQRLGFVATGIPKRIAGKTEEIRGPKSSAPEAAISGFLSKYNITKNELELRDDYYFLNINTPESTADDLIKETIESILGKYVWLKSMRYGVQNHKWVRPVHSMVCILDGNVIPITFNGIIASNKTRGHRFMHPVEISVSNFNDYKTKLYNAKVIISYEERRASIIEQAEKIAEDFNLSIIRDESLID